MQRGRGEGGEADISCLLTPYGSIATSHEVMVEATDVGSAFCEPAVTHSRNALAQSEVETKLQYVNATRIQDFKELPDNHSLGANRQHASCIHKFDWLTPLR
jgi:hypothetical protein